MNHVLVTRSIRKLLIVRPSALGDVARTVPAAASLRRLLPQARIDWLVQDTYADAVAHHPGVDHVVAFPRQRFGRIWRSGREVRHAWQWAGQLKRAGYDAVVDLQGLFRSGLFTWLTRSPLRIGFRNTREMAHCAYNRAHVVDAKLHTVDRMLALLEAEGCPPVHDMQLYVPPDDAQWADRYLHENSLADRPFVALAPTAQWRCKCWPLDRFTEVARRLLQHNLVDRVVVLAAPRERAYVQPMLDALGEQALLPSTSFGQVMAIILRCRGLIANDSAPLHIAVGFAKPLVAIFGPTDPALVGPYRRADTVVQPPDIAGRDLTNYRSRRDDQSIISKVTVQMVWEKLQQQE